MRFSGVEMVALAALLAASMARFWRRRGPVLKKILAAKPDVGF